MNHCPREPINGRPKNHVAYTLLISVIKLPRKLQHAILWAGLINQATPIKSLRKGNVVLDITSTSSPVGWIKSIRNILD